MPSFVTQRRRRRGSTGALTAREYQPAIAPDVLSVSRPIDDRSLSTSSTLKFPALEVTEPPNAGPSPQPLPILPSYTRAFANDHASENVPNAIGFGMPLELMTHLKKLANGRKKIHELRNDGRISRVNLLEQFGLFLGTCRHSIRSQHHDGRSEQSFSLDVARSDFDACKEQEREVQEFEDILSKYEAGQEEMEQTLYEVIAKMTGTPSLALKHTFFSDVSDGLSKDSGKASSNNTTEALSQAMFNESDEVSDDGTDPRVVQYEKKIGEIRIKREQIHQLETSFQLSLKLCGDATNADYHPELDVRSARATRSLTIKTGIHDKIQQLLALKEEAEELRLMCLAARLLDEDSTGNKFEESLKYPVAPTIVGQMYAFHAGQDHFGIRPIDVAVVEHDDHEERMELWLADQRLRRAYEMHFPECCASAPASPISQFSEGFTEHATIPRRTEPGVKTFEDRFTPESVHDLQSEPEDVQYAPYKQLRRLYVRKAASIDANWLGTPKRPLGSDTIISSDISSPDTERKRLDRNYTVLMRVLDCGTRHTIHPPPFGCPVASPG